VPSYVLIDRDGVINQRLIGGYVTSWPQFRFLPGVLEALRLLAENDYSAIVVSNQACVGKGLLSMEGLNEITCRFVKEVRNHGGRIESVYYCPHRIEDACMCRKPSPGLLLRAQREYGFSFRDTFVIGDSEKEVLAAHRLGCPAVLVDAGVTDIKGQWTGLAQAVVKDLYAAVVFILERDKLQQRPTSTPGPYRSV